MTTSNKNVIFDTATSGHRKIIIFGAPIVGFKKVIPSKRKSEL